MSRVSASLPSYVLTTERSKSQVRFVYMSKNQSHQMCLKGHYNLRSFQLHLLYPQTVWFPFKVNKMHQIYEKKEAILYVVLIGCKYTNKLWKIESLNWTEKCGGTLHGNSDP